MRSLQYLIELPLYWIDERFVHDRFIYLFTKLTLEHASTLTEGTFRYMVNVFG